MTKPFDANELQKLNCRELAERAYRAYALTTNWKNFRGDPMPQFADLPEQIQHAWEAAALEAAATADQTLKIVRIAFALACRALTEFATSFGEAESLDQMADRFVGQALAELVANGEIEVPFAD
ncbi:hypothetical protein D3C86_1338580 [compost metagenome]